MICRRVLYSGRVQGVGFRYTTEHLAQDFHIAGYVKNLPSGDVEVVAEGDEHQVEGFLNAIGRRMQQYIGKASIETQEPAGFSDFRVRY